MIRVTCPACQTKLNAKDELAGQTRKCPNCAEPVVISGPAVPSAPADGATSPVDGTSPDQLIHDVLDKKLPSVQAPEQLVRLNKYLICSKDKLVATWENNTHGWMLKTSAGFIPAKRNVEELPNQGNFTLIELKMTMTDVGAHRLDGVATYQLAKRWALLTLGEGDNNILEKITGSGSLNKDQKHLILKHLGATLMPEVWHRSPEVVDYLTNTDYRSQGIG